MSKPNYKKGGLVRYKYHVEKVMEDGIHVKEVDDQSAYFVLRVDKDPHARVAMAAYAQSVRSDNEVFANDLDNWLGELNHQRSEGDQT
jgi:predicted HicB family RNase H-like nuclease